MRLKRTFLCVLALTVTLTFSLPVRSEEAKDDSKVVLAEIGSQKITMQNFEKRLSELPEQYKAFFSDPERKGEFLNALVQQIVLAKKARELKLDQKPEVVEKINNVIDQVLIQELLKQEILNKSNPSDEEIKKYYEANLSRYKEPEKVKARHILIKIDQKASDDDKKKAEDKANEIDARAKKGEDFAKLAKEFSEDTGSKENGGDLGFFARGRMVKDFEEAAFKLKPGEVSDAVKTRYGYHIIKVEEKIEAHQKPLDEVKSMIKDSLSIETKQKSMEDYTKKLIAESKAVMHPELLNPKEKAEEKKEQSKK